MQASRKDPQSLRALAQSMYQEGESNRAVLRRCYGVDFPEEFFVMLDAWTLPEHDVQLPENTVWSIAIPIERGGPARIPPLLGELEGRMFTVDSNFVPLQRLGTASLMGYRIDELAEGRPTVFTLPWDCDENAKATRLSDSQLDLFEKGGSESLRRIEEDFARSGELNPEGSTSFQHRYSSYELEDLEGAKKGLAWVLACRRELASRSE